MDIDHHDGSRDTHLLALHDPSQQKRQKEIQQKREALTTGDRIVTSGGLFGVIRDIKEKEFVVEIADGVRVRVDKSSVFPAADDQGQK